MREQVKINDGDWFVEYAWKYQVRQAIRVTAQTIFYMGEGFNLRDGGNPKEHRVRLDKVVFACRDERLAKLVADQLTSSMALCEEERKGASVRMIKRDETIIANAR